MKKFFLVSLICPLTQTFAAQWDQNLFIQSEMGKLKFHELRTQNLASIGVGYGLSTPVDRSFGISSSFGLSRVGVGDSKGSQDSSPQVSLKAEPWYRFQTKPFLRIAPTLSYRLTPGYETSQIPRQSITEIGLGVTAFMDVVENKYLRTVEIHAEKTSSSGIENSFLVGFSLRFQIGGKNYSDNTSLYRIKSSKEKKFTDVHKVRYRYIVFKNDRTEASLHYQKKLHYFSQFLSKVLKQHVDSIKLNHLTRSNPSEAIIEKRFAFTEGYLLTKTPDLNFVRGKNYKVSDSMLGPNESMVEFELTTDLKKENFDKAYDYFVTKLEASMKTKDAEEKEEVVIENNDNNTFSQESVQ